MYHKQTKLPEHKLADEKRYIAVDLGAESGRVMLGIVSADPPNGEASPPGDMLRRRRTKKSSGHISPAEPGP